MLVYRRLLTKCNEGYNHRYFNVMKCTHLVCSCNTITCLSQCLCNKAEATQALKPLEEQARLTKDKRNHHGAVGNLNQNNSVNLTWLPLILWSFWSRTLSTTESYGRLAGRQNLVNFKILKCISYRSIWLFALWDAVLLQQYTNACRLVFLVKACCNVVSRGLKYLARSHTFS